MPTSRARVFQVAALVCMYSLFLGAPSVGHAQDTYPAGTPLQVSSPTRPDHRLLTFVPRLGVQGGPFVADFEREVSGFGARARTNDRVSGGVAPVLGADLLFRLRSGMRLGAGVYVMPRVSIKIDSDDPDLAARDLMLGTLLRVPFIIEWEIPIAPRGSLVVGAVPGLAFLVRGEQEQNRIDALCETLECGGSEAAFGPFLDGAFGGLLWLDSMALRFDVRAGIEILSLAAADEEGYDYDETLSGLRVQFLLGVEL